MKAGSNRQVVMDMTIPGRHIAMATIYKVDVLASWNFKHIVNLDKIKGYNSVNLNTRLWCTVTNNSGTGNATLNINYEANTTNSQRTANLSITGLGLAAKTATLTQQSAIPTQGFVAYYPFNGNAKDESGNGNNGTINGANFSIGSLWTSFGSIGYAWFNGNIDDIRIYNRSLTETEIQQLYNE